MESREIGRSGLRGSVIGLGCNNFGFFQDAAQATACVHAALEAGINFFDLAAEHGQGTEEALVGAALGGRRQDVLIATKFGQQELIGVKANGAFNMSPDDARKGASRRWIMQSVEESLKRLRTDYIDLYQPHVIDPDTPPEETLRALDDLVRQGKVRALGLAATNATTRELVSLQNIAEANGLTPFVSMEAHYNLLHRDAERELIPELRRRDMSLLPYWPLANGLLTGKYRSGAPHPHGSRLEKLPMVAGFYGPVDWDKVEVLRRFAQGLNMGMTELAFAWLLSNPTVASVIAGATTPQQVAENARAAGKGLSGSDWAELDRLLS